MSFKQKIKERIGLENIELVVHSKNYFISKTATKALAFLFLPIFTRLLAPSDYGTYSLFLSAGGRSGTWRRVPSARALQQPTHFEG